KEQVCFEQRLTSKERELELGRVFLLLGAVFLLATGGHGFESKIERALRSHEAHAHALLFARVAIEARQIACVCEHQSKIERSFGQRDPRRVSDRQRALLPRRCQVVEQEREQRRRQKTCAK